MQHIAIFVALLLIQYPVLAIQPPKFYDPITVLLLPPYNEFSPGKVIKHHLINHHFSTQPLFIVGDDAYSQQWLMANKQQLKAIHAMGIMAHVNSIDTITRLERVTGLQFISANLDHLSTIIMTNHYPLLIYKGWVMQ